ncbi:hypothetical protein LTR28_006122 [Elasticomyces elasticus]|nr:hypothetical protein LTR28_006122 [Elasticomyces elasticus]
MAPSIVHLPNGQNLTVSPIFGGLTFKANDLHNHQSVFPPGWTITINSEDDESDHLSYAASPDPSTSTQAPLKHHHVHRFKRPSLRNDHLYISSISNPNSNEFKPASSPTRQIAMMLWATLWWYFHQQEPDLHVTTPASANTPHQGRPKAEWRVNINREGIFKGKNLLSKLERMGLIASEDSSVGTCQDERVGEGWTNMFVSRRTFWQLDARIYLFTLSPMPNSPFPSASPVPSRPGSPNRSGAANTRVDAVVETAGATLPHQALTHGLWNANSPPGPFQSGSHLPTYYPPSPAQYVFTNNIRHPIRHKPPRQGETFYTRWIPSVGQYLSFRTASLSCNPVAHRGPVSSPTVMPALSQDIRLEIENSLSDSAAATTTGLNDNHGGADGHGSTDLEYLHKWMNDPRVNASWGEAGDVSHIESFLCTCLSSRHSFPAIGCWDGKPFGFFELYWVKEDRLGAHLLGSGNGIGDWDRGLHVLVGEQEYRGGHRVRVWLSALVHWCWLSDTRTERVVMEPRVDNLKLKDYCEEVGFYKEREIAFPHKQSNLMKIKRDAWEAPEL